MCWYNLYLLIWFLLNPRLKVLKNLVEELTCFWWCTTCPTGVLSRSSHRITLDRYVREAIPQTVLRILCLYHGRLPAILVLNKMDEIPKSRRIFDLIRKLTCNHLDDGQATVKITHGDTEGCSVKKYLKRKERALDGSNDGINDYPDILRIARAGSITEERCRGLTAGLVGWPGFRDVFTVSALNGEGVDQLREHLVAAARPGQWSFDPSLKTDSDPQTVMLGVVRSRLLANLPSNIPYSLQVGHRIHWTHLQVE